MSDLSARGADRAACYAVFGGVYNNYLALAAVLDDAERQGARAAYCLGDLGGFGPHPDRVFPLLRERGVTVMQGNYDHSIGNQLGDCGCGYTDPRDNHFAQLSYAYTQANTSARWLPYLRELPTELRASWGGARVLMAHGSPRRVNEFLWESQSSDGFLRRLLTAHAADVLLVTHSGIPWLRRVPAALGGGLVVNVGAIGRPANDGHTGVYYALIRVEGEDTPGPGADPSTALTVSLRRVDYDHERLARDMRSERLPEEFVETIETGWWTTCLEILPAKERGRGRY
ncbi:MAG: metallophosphoesterase family protein [Polyangia bacterium]